MVLGKSDSHMQKNETEPLSYTLYKNKVKMDERPKCAIGNHQNPRGEHRQKPRKKTIRFYTTKIYKYQNA